MQVEPGNKQEAVARRQPEEEVQLRVLAPPGSQCLCRIERQRARQRKLRQVTRLSE